MKNQITKNEYLQLIGLVTLGRKHESIVNECNNEISEIVQAEDNYTLITDAIYDTSEPDFKSLLKDMKITVEK